MIRYKPYRSGALFGMCYHFEKRGDGLSMHIHDESNIHNVIVLEGSVEVYGRGRVWARVLRAGQIFDFPSTDTEHEIVALENDSKIINFRLNGAGKFANLPDDTLTGIDEEVLIEKLPECCL